ncbi:probable ATP-dependent RNA helicase DDX60 [Rhineura floridana]|uniref:probable ATP-dependent RNA helicase DDX60 n=1 Tax=Rhineura floridana TaxID=261503 RepID=UPI002AC823B3|nr:probable ATP-dependent RNA helicase DDX60 [Rhineura floridana]XP_061440122.1 probable ATP-dependent RNA helicase DDX60 [Rhineura floridana]
MAYEASLVGDKASLNRFRLSKQISPLANVPKEPCLHDFQNPELQRCMGEITDFVLHEIPKADYVSLLNDYVESEFFLIDGDSLFITCAGELTLQRGQNLHFFFLAERFLLDLTSKGAKYIIVFFKDIEYLYFQNADLLSLRTALIIHLKNNTEIAIRTEFSNCLDCKWQDFLQEYYPYFLIICDEGLDQLQTYFLHVFILHTLSKKINVVLTSGQESDAIRVYGYHIHSLHRHHAFFKQHEKTVNHYYQTLVKYWKESRTEACLPLSGCPSLEALAGKAYKKLIQFQKDIKDLRYIVCIITCSLVLEMHSHVLESQTTSTKETPVQTALTLEEAGDLLRMYCLSVVFLHHLPISQRSRMRFIDACWNKEVLTFMQQQKLCEFHVLQHLATQASRTMDFSSLPDLSDDILWKNIAYYYELEKGPEFDLDVGTEMNRDYNLLWKHITALSGTCSTGPSFPLRITSKTFLEEDCSPRKDNASKITFPKPGIIPMMSSIVDEFAGDILIELPYLKSDDPVVTSLKKQKEFDELLHWHSRRPLSDDYDRTHMGFLGASKDPWALRSNQKLQTFLRFYGQSLEGNLSKTIAPQPDTQKKAYPHATKNKKVQKTKAEIIIEENKKRKRIEEEKKEECRWGALSVTMESNIKENMTSGIKNLEEFLKKCQSASVKSGAEMTALNVCFGLWMEQCKAEGKTNKNLNIAVEVMRRIHSLIANYDQENLLKETDFHQIAKCLWYFGFDNLAISLKYIKVSEDERKALKRKYSKYAVGMGSSRFQLQYMSPYLIREERKDPDPRVQYFIPDTWQRELLDIVDNNESAVIVAPTSSGKTYASYYCMEKILRDSDESVVVYVAPTKALVNQVWATISNRFDKALPAGLAVCGVFTRDYRHDALNCQILVTVPQCLEILLLSPRRQKWAQRIRYVIFDEVHCLGGEIGAEVWEHLLVMIRCPFLALSATISNPKHLADWLQSVKRYWQHTEAAIARSSDCFTSMKKGAKEKKSIKRQNTSYRVKLVVYGERYNDLEKHVCSLDHGDFTIHHYHPYAALTVKHIEKYGFPLDLSLSPRETVILYDIMVKAQRNWPRANELDPEEFFKDKIVITKADARNYERELKEELEMWTKHGNSKEANKVLLLLRPQPSSYSSETQMQMYFPHFVEKLKLMDKLPALFFLFSIKKVEELARDVCQFLEDKHSKKQIPGSEKEEWLTKKCKKIEKSLADQNDIKRPEQRTEKVCSSLGDNHMNRKQEQMLKKSKKIEKSVKKKQTDDTRVTHKDDKKFVWEAELDSIRKQMEKISEIPSDCTYANEHAIDNESLTKIFDRARFLKKNQILRNLALRGIGYHHASLEAKGRQMVEMLFRRGFIQVVTATGTLALGINMPCKSVVFVQNSVYLDALNYRQMSGRAGRRGYDLLGDVFFYDIPLPKIQKLIKSNVPELRGQFPLSISLILRLMLLASKADDKVDAKAKVLSLLKHSLLSFKQPRALKMLKLYFLFSLQFLVKEGYVDREGNTTGFCGLVTHLHYHEPSNIVLVTFLVKGLFHKLCQPSKKGSHIFSKDVMEKLVLVLAHLFGRRHIPAAAIKSERKFYQSMVFLEDLPEDFANALHEYNCKIAENFGQFLQTVSTLADMKQEYKLPLSDLDFSSKEQSDSPLASHLMSCDKGRTAVSPFACLSRNTELDLLHAGTVNSVILRTIGITAANIPILYSKMHDNQGRIMPLNAYALDFYKHGSLVAMAQDNGIHEGDAYLLLKDFALALKAISVSLSELCDNKDDNVVHAFEQLSQNYWEKLEKV